MSPFPSVFQNKYLIRDYYIKIKPECGNKKKYTSYSFRRIINYVISILILKLNNYTVTITFKKNPLNRGIFLLLLRATFAQLRFFTSTIFQKPFRCISLMFNTV